MNTLLRNHVLSSVAAFGLLAACSAVSTVGCVATSSAPVGDSDSVASDSDALTGATAVSRAMEWVTAELQYCQSPYHQHDPDDACSSTCDRESNSAWNPYRSDCSGLVSWAWDLPAPGRTTGEFAPAETAVSHVISAASLAPGDAVNIADEHIMLFKEWVHPGTEAVFIEEPGCSTAIKYAHEFTSSVSVSGSSIYVSYQGRSFTAIRYDGTTSSSTGSGSSGDCQPGGLYCGGDKVSGSSSTLYRCTSGSHGTVYETCAHGCKVNPGEDDTCNSGVSVGSGACYHNGLYCGGDKVTGYSDTLYRCTSGASGTEVEHCSAGCKVNPGANDACR